MNQVVDFAFLCLMCFFVAKNSLPCGNRIQTTGDSSQNNPKIKEDITEKCLNQAWVFLTETQSPLRLREWWMECFITQRTKSKNLTLFLCQETLTIYSTSKDFRRRKFTISWINAVIPVTLWEIIFFRIFCVFLGDLCVVARKLLLLFCDLCVFSWQRIFFPGFLKLDN